MPGYPVTHLAIAQRRAGVRTTGLDTGIGNWRSKGSGALLSALRGSVGYAADLVLRATVRSVPIAVEQVDVRLPLMQLDGGVRSKSAPRVRHSRSVRSSSAMGGGAISAG